MTGERIPTRRRICAASRRWSFSEQYRGDWADLVAEPLEVTEAAPGRILVLTRQSSRGRKSGVPIVIHFFQLWTVGDGKVQKIEFFRHRTDAMQAAGLSE